MERTVRLHPLAYRVLDAAVTALALFAAVSVTLGVMGRGPDAGHPFVRGGPLPSVLRIVLLGAFAIAVLLLRGRVAWGRSLARGAGLVLATACLVDALGYYRMLGAGEIRTRLPLPLSLLVAVLLYAWAMSPRPRRVDSARRGEQMLWNKMVDRALPLALVGLGVLAHLMTFGATDYRRPADAAVVFGAAVRADGRPSGSLADRVATAVELYHTGLVGTLVLSGGRNPAVPLSEPQVMARLAREAGVPAGALVLDEAGWTTRDTVINAQRLASQRGWTRLLGVSNDVHTARIRMEAERRGLHLVTVPAVETHRWLSKPLFVAREAAAWSWHLLRGAFA